MTVFPDLLLLRLDALALDVNKVRDAVKRAQQRGQLLDEAKADILPNRGRIRTVQKNIELLVDAIDDKQGIRETLRASYNNPANDLDLDNDLRTTQKLVEDILQSVRHASESLKQAEFTAVSLTTERSRELKQSLDRRCNKLHEDLAKLRREVETTQVDKRRQQWARYHELLEGRARPMFAEYVDFLGGLTVRDTGLDDRVCEMTDALLTRFKGVTRRSLPLPARHAALGTTLDSVVMLGFPEWSIWGIPLVGHEVGLAYANDEHDDTLVEFLERYAAKYLKGTDPARGEDRASAQEYVAQLLADAFATYTLGLSYACAALLLRLSPRHDEVPRRGAPRDIDRARVIMLTLWTGGRGSPASGGSFSDAIGMLKDIWSDAAKAHAGPQQAQVAAAEVDGPPPDEDWIDDFARDAVQVFTKLITIRPFDNDRWEASELWCKALREGAAAPGWTPADDAVPDVLTAAWRLRLIGTADPDQLATEVKKRWSTKEGSA